MNAMENMKNILVLTDFSDNAYNALIYASELFGEGPCKFILLHSIEQVVSRLTSRVDIGKTHKIVDELFSSTHKKLDALKETALVDFKSPDHSVETIASSRSLHKEVNVLIEKLEVDYVVMGNKGTTAAHDIFIGSTAARAIRKVKGAPLFIIPEEIVFEPLRKITFTTGLRRPYAEMELDAILNLPRADNAELQILYIQEAEKIDSEQRKNLIQLKEKFDSAINEVYWTKKKGSKAATILDFIFEQKSDVLAMVYYKHGFLASLFRESIIKKIGSHPSIPFLMIPAAN